MFLRNYYAAVANAITNIRPTYKNLQGNVQTAAVIGTSTSNSYYDGQYRTPQMASTAYMNLYLGSGTTAPTVDDYAMENDVTSSLASTPFQVSYTAFDSDYSTTATVVQTFVNNGSNDVTVSEVGLSHKYDNAYNHEFLYYRDTFTPVTVEPNKTLTITITMIFDGFSALANTQASVS